MNEQSQVNKTIFIILAAIGILLELVVIILMASDKIASSVATPLLVICMFISSVPVILAFRQSRK